MVINQYRYPKLDGHAIRLVEDSNKLKESKFLKKIGRNCTELRSKFSKYKSQKNFESWKRQCVKLKRKVGITITL